MPALLHIDSSPRAASVSSRLAAAFARRWQEQNPTGTVIHHNTTLEKIPYIDEAAIEAFFTPTDVLTPAQKQLLVYSDKLVDELLAADVIVLGVPMWNLGIPASLKAWIDMIVRAERTFAFTEQGIKPLLAPGKKVYVVSARGGTYPDGTPAKAFDQQEPYLRSILGFLGLRSIEFIYAENQSQGPEAAAEGVFRAEIVLGTIAA
jgi:FMN-dependent NADH-azoreductase